MDPRPPDPDSTATDPGFFAAIVGDGRPLLSLVGLSLGGSGLFALFLAATGHFLPHDEQFLGMRAKELCSVDGCKIVHFMIHDRASFGGVLVAIGLVYLWLAEFPLKRGEPWAWWLFLVSGTEGFASFFAYLGYGYLDTWHGAATLALLPCYVVGLALSYRTLRGPRGVRSLLEPSAEAPRTSVAAMGRLLLLATASGMLGAGATILVVGMTTVFVPQDLAFLGLKVEEVRAVNDRLVPLIAHDRAGFGGAVACFGLLLFFGAWCGRPEKSLWQAYGLGGTIGFAAAIGVHPAVGYLDAFHLAPAVAGALAFAMGLAAYRPTCYGASRRHDHFADSSGP